MGMPNNLVLVRHGQSEANIIQARIKQDPAYEAPEGFFDRHDSEMRLSAEGVRQAEITGRYLDQQFYTGFNKYYVSSLARTVETAGRLAIDGNWKIDDRWRERDWGEYGVLNDEERQTQYELSHKLKQQNKWYWRPPGGESLATGVRSRFEDILDTLHREADGKDVVVVTHGEMIDVARFVIERMTPDEWLAQDTDPAFRISNCQVLRYSRINPKTGYQDKYIRWRQSVCVWDDTRSWDDGEWSEVERKIYSDSDLTKSAESHQRLL